LLSEAAWQAKAKEGANGSHALVRDLLDEGVRVILCGQSAAAHGITQADLIPGVEMALSAMTAHALLQQAGYSVNPF
jgi:intracellular sulfur oxidation DsrE/DsrF family protein